ncbi:porin [Oxalobacteraceae bacterium]|nr:porin [Oxalobacteraceae bacterium]
MKRTPLSLAVFASLAIGGAAHAQSNVQVYGLLDMGVDYATDAKAGGGSLTRVSSGGMNTSRWGLRGTEDLGGGLKAVFQLEGGILMDNGASDGVLFKRQANVGLEGGFGKVVLGRSFTSVYDTIISYDPMGFAPMYSWATSGPATGPSKYGFTTAFDNLIKYSGTAGPVKFGASYGFGEQATGARDSAKFGTTLAYNIGPVNLMGTYERVNGNTVAASGRRDKNTVWHLGANFENGPVKLFGVVRNFKTELASLAPEVEASTIWGGISYKIKEATLTGAIYHINVKNTAAGKDADPTLYVARYRYALSKRTDLYVSAAYAKAKNGQLTGLSRDDAGFGEKQRGFMTGMQHRF